MHFRLHDDLDLAAIRRDYARDARTRIHHFLPVRIAEELAGYIATKVEFGQAFVLEGRGRQATREQLNSLSEADSENLRRQVLEQASRGIGYWYGRHDVTESSPDPVRAFLRWLNDEETLNVVREITGVVELKRASAQITCFLPGDFLTRHNDVYGDQERRIAYAYYLSRSWHPDWGGLLQFFRQNGEPRDAWSPEFNALNLFDVTHVHSVTNVSAFAPGPRYAVSGWFKSR